MVARRTLVLRAYALAGAVGYAAIVLAAAGFARAHPPISSSGNAALIGLAYAVGIAWWAAFTTLYWRRLDETAREAQKFAWLAGGLAAIALTAPPMMFMRITGAPFLADLLRGAASPGLYFALGWLTLAVAQVGAFLAIWAGWWIARR